MKIFIFSFAMIMLNPSLGISQEPPGIKLTNVKKPKQTEIIPLNKKIRISLIDPNEILTGEFTISNDSTIVINGTSVQLTNINSIKARTVKRYVSGSVLVTAGVIAFPTGLYFRSNLTSFSAIYASLIGIIGGSVSTIYGVVLLSTRKDFELGAKWEPSLIQR